MKADCTPKLLDFGIAKQLENMAESGGQTQTVVRFTRNYAAPEQIRGEPAGIFTDVYALGVLLYELLAEKTPFDLENCTPGQAELIITGEMEPRKLSLSANRLAASRAAWKDLDVLCAKALKKDVQRRYHSVTELIQDIDRFLNSEPLQARPDSLSYRVHKFVLRHRTTLFAASVVAILIAGVVAFYTWRLASARNAAVAEAERTEAVEQFLENLFEGGDRYAGPASDLKVTALLDRGLKQLPSLTRDTALQADLYQTLGTIYRQLGNFNQADQLLQKAWSLRRSIPGDDLALADSMLALATLRIDQARLTEAEKLSREALALDLQRKSVHSEAERATSTLARVLEDRGQYKQALDMLTVPTGPAGVTSRLSVDRAETLNVLGDAYFYLGRYADARLYYSQAANLSKSIFGPHHPRIAENVLDLGHVEIQLGHYQEAERYYREALDIERTWYGNEHPLTARAETYVAQALGWQTKFKEGRDLLEHALLVEEKNYGPNHPQVALVLSSLGAANLELNRLTDAEANFMRMLAIYRSSYGEKHQFTALALCDIGSLYILKKQYPRAVQLLREALAIYIQVLPAGALNTAVAEVKLGRALLREKHYRDAERYSLPGYETIKRQASPSIEYLKPAGSDLIEIYSSLSQPAKATRIRAELQAIQMKR